ncbi:ABC transporter permease subunit [Actinomadura sp. 7K507]|uniref:ABC transporter permease subunit n=1 Tax=Actinomadura sp. 7K507 TaxID=2530365 RepID=UPI001048AB3E|nr:ABC transporter permease subunit [Actinomadura sp. 7K507]TDC81715.1 ABC transporter permease [Actinomadura sp. 7K507]
MTTLTATTRAELLRLRRWPALWTLGAVWLLLSTTFGYVFPYLSYRNGGGFASEGEPRQLLADVMPESVPLAAVQGMPMFGGAILFALGALAAGSGYGWGTWKTALTQGPGRSSVLGGTFTALGGIVLVVLLGTFALDMGIALSLAAVEGQGIVWPSAGDLARGLGAGALILALWTTAGLAIGTLVRSPALAVALGLVWTLAVENLLRAVSSLLDWLVPVTDVLPGTAAGSIAAAVGARPVSEEGGTPGVVDNLTAAPAVAVMLAYIVVFVIITGVLMRRDVP